MCVKKLTEPISQVNEIQSFDTSEHYIKDVLPRILGTKAIQPLLQDLLRTDQLRCDKAVIRDEQTREGSYPIPELRKADRSETRRICYMVKKYRHLEEQYIPVSGNGSQHHVSHARTGSRRGTPAQPSNEAPEYC
jgi:hypothetical protein